MIICPNCNYQNPDAASQCEACYTPLPSLITCANCGAAVQADASFCGQCGHSLANQNTAAAATIPPAPEPLVAVSTQPTPLPDTPAADLVEPEPLVELDPLPVVPPPPLPVDPVPANVPTAVDIYSEPSITQPAPDVEIPQTQIQSLTARLLHVQTDTVMELPAGLELLHIGKPNDRIPPDIDVSGFPESEIVSRVHSNIRIEGDVYYIEDVGSSNGTYINNLPLAAGNRHRLRPGDRIALGKGDKVSFIFQLA
ncbi:MAG: FHA domain-containing protein [Leptolyngbya sp. SIO3F4]|nr:FHA domain-containing protein [Leptolyngbya sp. SIO3F4]